MVYRSSHSFLNTAKIPDAALQFLALFYRSCIVEKRAERYLFELAQMHARTTCFFLCRQEFCSITQKLT